MEEDGTTIVDLAFMFFERYNISEIVFFYIILQLLLLSRFEKNDLFDGLLDKLDYPFPLLTSQFFFKPFFLVFCICLWLLFGGLCVLFLAFGFYGLIQWAPDIWLILFSKEITPPRFNVFLATKDGIILLIISYLFCYSSHRNNDIQLQNDELRKMYEGKIAESPMYK
jgi:hypothetical protein